MLPQDDAVRVEEIDQLLPLCLARPGSRRSHSATSVTVMPTPWDTGTKLVNIGIKGYDIAPATRPHANLVFLIDTSGSMEEPEQAAAPHATR